MKTRLLLLSLSFAFVVQAASGTVRTFEPQADNTFQQPTTRAIVFGVSAYQDANLPVNETVRKDAELFTAFLRSRSGGLLPAHFIQLNTGKQATLAQFTAALAWLEEESLPGDRVVFYLSGHAKMLATEPDEKPFFFFSDSPSVPATAGALSLSAICYSVQELCSRYSLSYSLFLQLDVLPAQEAGSDLWREWMDAFEVSFPSAWVGWSKGKEAETKTFTQLLIDGSFGAADRNSDGEVGTKETVQYLKTERKKVPEGAAFLMAFSNAEAIVGQAQPEGQFSTNAQKRESDLFPSIVGMDVTKLEDSLLAKENKRTVGWYNDFIITMKLGQLMSPPGHCASDLYDSLSQMSSLAPLHSHWRRKLGAALLDETQQVLNAYLKTDNKELFRRWAHADQYAAYPVYMARAIELLGPRSFMMPILQTKLHYFEGLKARLDGLVKADTTHFQKALEEQLAALSYEPEAAFVWNELGVVYALLGSDSATVCFQQATIFSPTWGIPYSNLSLYFQQNGQWEMALMNARTAVVLSPWNVVALNSYGNALMRMGEYEEADEQFRQAISMDINYPDSYYNLSCLQSLKGEVVSSAHWLEQAIGKGFDDWQHILTDADLENLRKTLQFGELKEKYAAAKGRQR